MKFMSTKRKIKKSIIKYKQLDKNCMKTLLQHHLDKLS